MLGWTGLKEVLEHAHSETENSYCTMTYCSCLVGKEVSVCTCHHKKEKHETAFFNIEETQNITSKTCFYDVPHKQNTLFSIGITLHDYNGYLGLTKNLTLDPTANTYYLSDIHLSELLLTKGLLRPPIS